MWETFDMPYYLRRTIEVNYSPFTAEWNITNKNSASYSDVNVYMTYGTERANAFKILEENAEPPRHSYLRYQNGC